MKKYFILYLFLFWTAILNAQQTTNSITGKITGVKFTAGSKVTLFLYKPDQVTWVAYVPDSTVSSPIDTNGNFQIKFNSSHPLFYATFIFYKADEKLNVTNEFSATPYLCAQGDSLFLDLKIAKEQKFMALNNKAWFTGKGADKYNAQYLVNLYDEPLEARGPYYNSGPYNPSMPLSVMEKVYRLHQQYRLEIIDAFQDRLPFDIKTRMKKDIIAQSKYKFVRSFLLQSYIEGNVNLKPVIAGFVKNSPEKGSLTAQDDNLIGVAGYADFVLMMEEMKYRIKNDISRTSKIKSLPTKEYVPWMYNNLKNNYNGTLRESLLTTWFLQKSRELFSEQEPFLADALTVVENPIYRKVLMEVIMKGGGNQAFPFKWINEEGNIKELKDYTNKILVLDFWYTGCPGCTYMPPVMKAIKEKFKNRKDVAFLSVSIDPSMRIWKQGLESGLYTFPGQIHLKTIENGRTDPFILNYRITGYPRVVVIGKQGKMLSAFPVDPREDKGKFIIDLISQHLY